VSAIASIILAMTGAEENHYFLNGFIGIMPNVFEKKFLMVYFVGCERNEIAKSL
jgi:hypothetical protein